MNHGNAVPGGSDADDRVLAPASFAEFVMNIPDEHHPSLSQNGEGSVSDVSFVVEEQLALYKLLIKEYNDFYAYVHCHYAAKIEEMKERIRGFDGSIETTRTQIRDTLVNALHKIPAEPLVQVVQECQWPNEDVCRDLELPLDFALMYRAGDAAARIKELEEAIIHKLSIGSKGGIIPVKKAFLLQFGGGNDPALLALAELKKLRQGQMSMKQFGPLISDLLDRAQVFRPGVQIGYFKERINSELLRAVIYRGPKTLIEAINITTEVEEGLQRLGQNAMTPIIPSINYGTSSSGSSALSITEQQNFQRTGGFKGKHRHGGVPGALGSYSG
ncbi:hypothetical protein BD408DRAFT_472690 [Parasitella parasitica]|nr:hypothetical protein BD408DRAFT_472690 [Parasitella parasitica]